MVYPRVSLREFTQIVMVPFEVILKVKLHYIYMQERKRKIRKPRSSGSVKIGYGVDDIDIESCIEEASNKQYLILIIHQLKQKNI